ncbi:winged helix-turn-helix transcriptional regulator [uncultured Fibrella sp.]|uniref:winged helix-turn-helix transcriptional regulator n=1 Tax=uncultured Fibrella sp. TaxID=1284596 RepID=UPI0035CC0672
MKQSRVFENPTDCPVVQTMSIIGGRWKPIILYCLMSGKLRFGKLALFIPTISRKILTEQLKELKDYGLINREEYNEQSLKVEYSLTELGKSLIPVINAMCTWGQHEGRTIKTK